MNEAGGGEHGSCRSGPSQTPCKESCRAGAGLDTLLRPPRGWSPRQGTHCPPPPAPGALGRDPQPKTHHASRSAATSPCPWHIAEPPAPRRVLTASKSLVPLPWLRPVHSLHLLQAGAALGSDAACAATLPAACPAPSTAFKHRHLLLLAEALQGDKPAPFSTQKTRS